MKKHFRLMNPLMSDGVDAIADFDTDTLTLELPAGAPNTFSLSHLLGCISPRYQVAKPDSGWKTEFTDEEKAKLRPVAETLAMLDQNAFFGMKTTGDREWYEAYLGEAHALWEGNGGDTGWAGASSMGPSQATPIS